MKNSDSSPLPFRDYKKIVDENVSRETFSQLEIYVNALLKWNKSIRLIAESTEADIWGRHIFDGLQILPWIPDTALRLFDLGSGGGIPALVVAASRPNASVCLVESDQRKCVFLEVVAREMGLKNTHVLNQRIEELTEQKADIVTARALATLKNLIDFSTTLRHTETRLIFHKGRLAQDELQEAAQSYDFSCEKQPSALGEGGCLLRLTNIKTK